MMDTEIPIVLESFPQNTPEFKRESCVGRWGYFIKHRLKNYLNNQLKKVQFSEFPY